MLRGCRVFFPVSLFWLTLIALVMPTAQVWAQSFTLSVTPSTVTIHPGDRNVPVTVNVGSSSYTGPVSVAFTGLPSGTSFSPIVVTAGITGTLYLRATVSADQEAFPASAPQTPNSYDNSVSVVGIAGSTQVTVPMTLTVSLSNPAFAPTPSQIDLPILSIDTGGTAVASKTINVPGTVSITSADGKTTYLPNSSDSDNTATFHVHGNSTSLMPKLPYEMKLGTSVDLLTAMGMKCPYVTSSGKAICDKSKTYVLLANYDDKTFLRDWAASALANAIPMGGGYLTSPADSPSPSGTSTLMPWAPHSLFVELYLNGAYEGNYQLIEKVNVDSHRINITELTDSDSSGDLSGGYQMEIDQENGEDYMFTTPQNVVIGMNDPDFTPEVPEQTSYITNYVDTAENALFSSNFTDPALGWRAYFDEASAINFYIVNDVMGNQDGGSFYSSDYFYKAIDSPLIYMGPIWDFDISSGNFNGSASTNPTVPWMQTHAPWYVQWLKDPGFKADLVTQWNALKNNSVFTTWIASINQQAASLQQSQTNNFGRWPMQGITVWPNAEAAGSYQAEVSYMTSWIETRIAYLDSLFNQKAQSSTTLSASLATVRQGSPVTFSAHVSATSSNAPSGTVTFIGTPSINYTIDLGTATLDGNGNATLTANLLAGAQTIEAVFNGDSHNALSASSNLSITVLPPLVGTVTALISSVSNATALAPASFTVVVVPNSGTTIPTGTVSFTVNGQPVATVALGSTGSATFAPAQLPGGADSIQAAYSGDGTYQASFSNMVSLGTPPVATPLISLATGVYTTAQTVTISDSAPSAVIFYTTDGSTPTTVSTQYNGAITVAATETLNAIALLSDYSYSAMATATYTIPTFTLASSTSALTFNSHQPGTMNLTISPEYGFNQTITFACSGLPSGDACSFAPASTTPGSGPTTVAMTLAHGDGNTSSSTRRPIWPPLAGGAALALLILPMRRRKVWPILGLGLMLLAGFTITACSSAPQSYLLTVTASGGGVSHSVQVVVAQKN